MFNIIKKYRDSLLIVFALSVCGIFVLALVGFPRYNFFDKMFLSAQTSSPDAVAVRVIPNREHMSASRWYKAQGFTGSPQPLVVDGYEAVRDGRTVYVNAANVDLVARAMHTNIYLISYNQEAEDKTRDIFGRILSHWKFNTNLIAGETVSGGPAVCGEDGEKRCLTDDDCGKNDYCTSAKAQVTRDTLRMSRLYDAREAIEEYGRQNGRYPPLAAGTYLPHITISVWPSWEKALAQYLGGGLPVDPVNKLADCGDPRFHPVTCWDENQKEFAWTADLRNDTLPDGNYVFIYQANDTGSDYTLCAFSETGMMPAADMCSSDCIPFCYGRECGDDRCGGNCAPGCVPPRICVDGVCRVPCATGPGCRENLARAFVTGDYCAAGGCYECNPGYVWNAGAGRCDCAPDCSCAAYTCDIYTCPDGCGGTCPGAIDCSCVPDCVCAFSTCDTATCGDGCGGICPGLLDCACDRDCSCAASECIGNVCFNGCGEPCAGTRNCACEPDCACADSVCIGETCVDPLCGITCNGRRACCPAVNLNSIDDITIYAAPGGEVDYYYGPIDIDITASVSSFQPVVYNISGKPDWMVFTVNGRMYGRQTDNVASTYDLTVTALNSCGASDSETFTLTVLPNAWCGDGVISPWVEECDPAIINANTKCDLLSAGGLFDLDQSALNCANLDSNVWRASGIEYAYETLCHPDTCLFRCSGNLGLVGNNCYMDTNGTPGIQDDDCQKGREWCVGGAISCYDTFSDPNFIYDHTTYGGPVYDQCCRYLAFGFPFNFSGVSKVYPGSDYSCLWDACDDYSDPGNNLINYLQGPSSGLGFQDLTPWLYFYEGWHTGYQYNCDEVCRRRNRTCIGVGLTDHTSLVTACVYDNCDSGPTCLSAGNLVNTTCKSDFYYWSTHSCWDGAHVFPVKSTACYCR